MLSYHIPITTTMKSLFTIILISLAAFAQAQTPEFCIKNDTHSDNYQFRIAYTCSDDNSATTWSNWIKIGEGPNIATCINADDLKCKSWTALTLEVRTGNSANTANLSAPSNGNITKMTLIDPLNDNVVGTISWDSANTVRIF